MLTDITTIAWKEMKEMMQSRGGRSAIKSGWLSLVIIIGMLGIYLPWQSGKAWIENPSLLLVWAWLPVFLTISLVTDAFAGERERHTLETLLASRLSDSAILLGKIAAAVLYGWTIALVGLLVGAITVNLSAGSSDGILFYPLASFFGGLALILLVAILVSSLGMLVSLRAPTARQAYQTLSITIMAIFLIPTILVQVLPADLKTTIFAFLESLNLPTLAVAGFTILVLLDAALIAFTLARFRRNRLILD
jgi:ABC-2 type transport system permease protein